MFIMVIVNILYHSQNKVRRHLFYLLDYVTRRSEKLGISQKNFKKKRFTDKLTRNVYQEHTFASLKDLTHVILSSSLQIQLQSIFKLTESDCCLKRPLTNVTQHPNITRCNNIFPHAHFISRMPI